MESDPEFGGMVMYSGFKTDRVMDAVGLVYMFNLIDGFSGWQESGRFVEGHIIMDGQATCVFNINNYKGHNIMRALFASGNRVDFLHGNLR